MARCCEEPAGVASASGREEEGLSQPSAVGRRIDNHVFFDDMARHGALFLFCESYIEMSIFED